MPEDTENRAFVDWFREWIAIIDGHRASADRMPVETANTGGQDHPEDAHLAGPKQRAASGRYVR